MGVSADPAEADPPLVVDPDAVLPEPVGSQFFQAVGGRHSEIGEARGGIQHQEFAKGYPMKIRGNSPDPLAAKQSLGVGVTKATDHEQ